LKEIILSIYKSFGIKSFRTKNIVKHIGSSFFLKAGSILANFMIIPLSIDYLDTENFGVWLTISSFISWFSFFDIGLGNGLRNKFTESIANNDFESAKGFVSTAYYTIGAISLLIFLVFFVVNQHIDWSTVFNTSTNDNLSVLLLIIFSFFCIQLVSNLIISIYQADQHHSIQNYFQFIVQITSLLLVWLLTKTEGSSLLLFGSIYSALPLVIIIFLNIFSFQTKYKEFKPKLSYWRKDYLMEITGLGFKFFIIQIAAIILFSTDNFIITKLFGPEEVVPYNLAYKYFSIVIIIFSVIVTPFWSSFTEAYEKKDFNWIKKSVNNIQKIWLLLVLFTFLMLIISNWFYYIWVGDKVLVPINLSISMALFVLLTTFNMVYVNFINGVGKLKLQLITAIISMIINIPLSIYFSKYLEWGVSGVILATCFCSLYSVILKPMQYYKIINKKAKGIWNR
tara:strand:+ start:1447 stop:2805 length:1359 start_codon:yes stop_codon:yes gene_type:complete